MDGFKAAEQRYADLKRQYDRGSIDRENFLQEVYKLRLRDPRDVWWQIDPETGQWLAWDGSAWQPGRTPPRNNESLENICLNCGQEFSEGERFCTYCGAPVGDVGPTDATASGAGSGTEGSPRQSMGTQIVCPNCRTACPQKSSHCSQCGARLAAGHWRVSLQTKRVATGRSGGRKPKAPAWKHISLKGPVLIALAWFAWSVFTTVRTLTQSNYGKAMPDFLSPLAMVGLPWIINKKHVGIDRFLSGLRYFQAFRRRIPGGIRVGMGLAMPLLTNSVLYSAGIKNYPLMFSTLMTSVPLSYALLREPAQHQADDDVSSGEQTS